MTLEETMTFIQSVNWLGCRPGLERITGLMRRLGDPQKDLRYVHITGTNGKGSTAAMLSAILQAAGYTVHLSTSAALQRTYQNQRQGYLRRRSVRHGGACKTGGGADERGPDRI